MKKGYIEGAIDGFIVGIETIIEELEERKAEFIKDIDELDGCKCKKYKVTTESEVEKMLDKTEIIEPNEKVIEIKAKDLPEDLQKQLKELLENNL